MKFSFSLLTAFVAIASAATKPDTSKDPKGNPVYTPALDEQVPVGEETSITWDPTTPGKVSILLLRGPSTNMITIDTLADSIENTGSFPWTPSTELENDKTHYGLQIVVEGTGQYQYSNQFGIKNGKETAPTESAPAPEPSAPAEDDTPAAPSASLPYKVITTTICECNSPTGVPEAPQPPPYAPAPTGGVPGGTGSPQPPVGSTSLLVSPTPVPSNPAPPPFEGAAGRNTVGFGGAILAMAAVLAF